MQYARKYALRAERKMGEILKATELAKGGQPYQATPTNVEGVENPYPPYLI